ncbi:MAG TPA: hypothetical protein PKA10_13350 [Selenomonadales bacterium]|nr:hypothetical protein [Selenomonadales bacterium]
MNKQELSEVFREFIQMDHVVGIGKGYKRVRGEDTGQEAVVVLVRKKYPKSDLQRSAIVPRKAGNIPTDVIEVGDIRLLGGERTGIFRPAQPGVSIGHYQVSAGTFGAVVRDRSTGEPLILSNNHVLANLSDGKDERSTIGDPILQPALYDGGDPKQSVIAHLRRFVPVHREVVTPQCRIAQLFEALINKCVKALYPKYQVRVFRENERVNLMDCAVAAPVSAEAIAGDILEIGPIAGIKEPKVGMTVKKSGRSSGLTHSIVLATEVTLQVGISRSEFGVFSDQVLAGPMSKPGDSGSLILSEDNHAVGLLFAGSDQATMFSRIDHVLDALNVTF